jgi:hypothetical protein
MFELIAEYGDKAAAFLVATAAALLTRYVWNRITRESLRGIAQRSYAELIDAVLEVWQTYTSTLKERNADGELSEEEKAEAKRRALEIAKTNLGAKGLKRLGRALGFTELFGVDLTRTESWMASKVETAVATLKSNGMLMNGVRKGTYAVPVPLDPR